MRIGIDLGGTKIEGVALDRNGEIRLRQRIPTPDAGYDSTISAVVDLIRGIESAAGASGSIGIAIPGALSPASGLVKNANSICLIGHPLDRDVADALGRPVRVANDADCFALSEATDGAAAGRRTVFGVILGTGVGGGLVVDRRLVVGPNAITGEWGHNPLPWPTDAERPGPACYCGRRGCIETFLSGPGLAADHLAHTGEAAVPPDICDRGAAGDPAAAATLDRYADRLARALAGVVNILDPDAIVLGGGLSNADFLYGAVAERLPLYVFSDQVTTPLLAPAFGDSSGVRGAAWLWPERAEGG